MLALELPSLTTAIRAPDAQEKAVDLINLAISVLPLQRIAKDQIDPDLLAEVELMEVRRIGRETTGAAQDEPQSVEKV
jgi:hypothetical protein